MEIRELPLDDLVLDPNLNLRDRLDEFAIERYTEAWERMPSVTVFEVEGRWLLADGFHRHAAAVVLKRRTIPAEVREGTFADALEFASGVNLFHGLPLTRAERRRSVEVKLRLRPDWSDRRLAEELATGRDLVAKVRRQLVESGQIPATDGRVGADGKTYPAALARDPNERLPRGPAKSEPDDPRDRGGRESDPPPWDDTTDPLPPLADSKVIALAEPAAVATPTIEEMLAMMTRHVSEVIAWTEADGFPEAYATAGVKARTLFQNAVGALAARAEALRKAS